MIFISPIKTSSGQMVTKKLPGNIKKRCQYSPAGMLEHLFHRHVVKDCHKSYDTELRNSRWLLLLSVFYCG